MSNFYQTEQWWRHSHSMIINKSQSVSFLHHTNQNYHPARFLIVINHLIRNTQSFTIFAVLPPHIPQFLRNSGWTQGWRKKTVSEGVNPIKTLPIFFCGFGIHIKNTFCKKIGSKRSFQPSAVVRAIYTPLYGVTAAN